MKNFKQSTIWTIGLAIFSMLFGAGNIMYPIKCGAVTGNQNYIGIMGFILTGVLLPILGLITMILFDGDYKKFFYRIGKTPGSLAILYCMLILGPLITMPRCITVPFEMLAPCMPGITLPIFSILFACIVFLMTYKESKILSLLGNIISPLLLCSLAIIAIKGLWQADTMIEQSVPITKVFITQFIYGFQTLDLLGSLFFAYIVLRILKENNINKEQNLAMISLKSCLIAGMLLMTVYVTFSFLSAYYGNLVTADMNGAAMFRIISLHILHKHSIIIIMIAVLMACLSTVTALAAVFAEYMHQELSHKKLNYITCLAITMAITTCISNFGLDKILYYSTLPINIGYPIIIAITLCNLAYRIWGMQYIKIPVAITAIITTGIILYC